MGSLKDWSCDEIIFIFPIALALWVIHLSYGFSLYHQSISLATSDLAAAMIYDNNEKGKGLLGYGNLFLIIKYLCNDICAMIAIES